MICFTNDNFLKSRVDSNQSQNITQVKPRYYSLAALTVRLYFLIQWSLFERVFSPQRCELKSIMMYKCNGIRKHAILLPSKNESLSALIHKKWSLNS